MNRSRKQEQENQSCLLFLLLNNYCPIGGSVAAAGWASLT